MRPIATTHATNPTIPKLNHINCFILLFGTITPKLETIDIITTI